MSDDPVLSSASYLVIKAGHSVAAELEAVLPPLGLTTREAMVLAYVSFSDGLFQQELSERLGLDPTLVVGLVDGLEGRGLLQRVRDARDRRRNLLQLTEEGMASRHRAVEAMAAVEDSLLGPLSEPERHQLRAALRKVMAPRLPWID